jgi:hypothetical protein
MPVYFTAGRLFEIGNKCSKNPLFEAKNPFRLTVPADFVFTILYIHFCLTEIIFCLTEFYILGGQFEKVPGPVVAHFGLVFPHYRL